MASGTNDTRIVEMQFENKDFEKNISQSQKSLEKFKKELNFEDTSKGMEKFSKSIKDMDGFDTLSSNIQKLTDKFTGLGTASEFVLSRIRRSLEAMGDKVISFANSLTAVQAQAGFTKYETLNKAVQTIKAATGQEESKVYSVLERLNKYTDETSYDFSEMVSSIGKFTSAGIKLSKAEKAMEGIANWAALSGAGIQEANRAMYNLSQSMGQGHLTLVDWKSIENANMATKEFKQELIDAGVAAGVLEKKDGKVFTKAKKGAKSMEVTWKNFRETLSTGWATNDVLMATLEKYADTTTELGAKAYAAAQRCLTFTDALNAWKDMLSTGWMQTYRTVFGELTDAMNLFSGICNKVSEALGGLSDARNRILKSWKGFGGRDSLWGMLIGEFESPDAGILYEGRKGILDLITGTGDLIQDAFWDMVKESMSAEDRAQLEMWAGNTEAMMDLMAQQGLLDGASEEDLKALRAYIEENFGERGLLYGYLGGKLAEATQSVQSFIENIYTWFNTADNKGVTRFEKIKSVVQSIFNTIKFIGEIIGGIFDFIGEIFAEDQLGGAVDSIITFFSTLAGAITGTENDISKSGGITEFFHNLAEAVKPVTSFLSESVKTIMAFFTSLISGGEKADGQTNTWEKINEFFATIASILSNIGQPIIDTITNIFNALSGGEKKADDGKEHTSFFTTLLDILVKVSSVIGKVIGFIGNLISGFITWGKESGFFAAAWEKIKSVVSAVWETIKKIAKPFAEFFGSIGSILQDLFSNGFNAESLARAGEAFKQAFSKLTGDLGAVFQPMWEKIKTTFTNLFDNLKELVAPIVEKIKNFFKQIFGKADDAVDNGNIFQKIIDWAKTGFEAVKNFFANLGGAFTQAGTFSEKVAAVFGQITDFFKNCNLQTILLAILGGLTVVAIALLVRKIVRLVKKVGGALVTIADSITNGFKLKGTSDKVESFGTKMLKFAAAIAILTGCVYFLANMKPEAAVQGLVSLAVIMAALALFTKSITKSMKDVSWKQVGAMALAMFAVGAAVAKMIGALRPIMELSGEGAWEQWGRMMLSLVVILGALGLFFKAVDKMDINFKKMSGIISLALGIWLLVKTLMSITSLGWGEKNGYALEKMGGALIAVVASLVAVGLAVRKAPKKTFRDIGLMLAGLSLLLFTLKGISGMSDQQLIQMGKGFAGLIAGLLILTAGIALINKKVGSAKGSGMKELAYATAAMAILVFALKPLADMGWGQLGKMGASFGVLIAGLLILTAGLAKINEKSIGLKGSGLGSLLVAALGMWAIVMALKPVADMEWGQIGKMGAVFGGLIAGLLVLVGGMRLIEKKFGGGMKKSLGFGAMLTLVLGIVGLIEVLKPVANMEWGQLGKMGAVFGAIVAGLAIAVGVIQGTSKKFSQALGSILTIVAFVFAIWELIGVLSLVNNLTDDQLIRMGVTFAVLITGMAVAMGMASKVSKNGKKALAGIATMAALAGLIYVLGLVMKDTADLGWEHMLAFSGSVMLVCLAMIPIANAIQKLADIKLTKGVKSIVMLGVMIAAVGAALALTSKLAKGVSWKTLLAMSAGILIASIAMIPMAKAIKALGDIDLTKGIKGIVLLAGGMIAIGAALSLVASMLGEGIGNGIESLTTHLGKAAVMVAYFSDQMGRVDEGNIEKGKRVAEKLKDVITSLTGLSGNVSDIDAFAMGVWEVAVALNAFHGLTSEIKGPDENGAIKLLEWFKTNAGTFKDLEFGDAAMAIAELGAGLWIFNDLGNDVPDDVAEAPIVKLLKTLADSSTGLTTITQLPLDQLGDQLAELGGAMMLYAMGAEEVAKVQNNGETPDVSAATEFLQQVVAQLGGEDMQVTLPTLPEESTLTDFGKQLAALAGALKKFINESNGINGNTEKAVAILGVLTELNGKLTDDVIRVVTFFPNSGISTLMLGKLGLDLVVLAEGLKAFCAVEVPDNVEEALSLLDYFAELNQKLTDAKIDETAKLLSAYMSPIDKDLMGQEGYSDYTIKALEDAGEQQSAITAFTFGIKQLGAALQQFVNDTKDYFTDEYKTPIENAKKAIQFFQEQFNLMPKIDRGWIAKITSYSQDLGDLAAPIIQLGPALASFSQALTTQGYDAETAASGAQVIATLVDAYVKINDAIDDMFSMISRYSYNEGTDLGGYFKRMGEQASDLIDGGKAMRWLGKQLNYVITSMTDTEYSGIQGMSVLDNYLELVVSMRDKMDQMNITQADVDRVSSGFTTLSNLVAVFHPENYPTDSSISNYLNALLTDIHSVLFKDGQKLPYEIDEITSLFDSMSESLNALLTMTSGYTSIGTEGLKQAGKDFGTYLGSLMDTVWAYLKEASPYSEDYDSDVESAVAFLTDMEQLAEVINKVAESYTALNSIPNVDESLGNIGHSLAESIAEGISDDLSQKTIRTAISSLISGTVGTIMFDPSLLLGGGISLTQQVGRNLMSQSKVYMNTWTESFRKASTSDVMAEFRNVLSYQEEGYTASFQDLGFFMGLMIATGVADSKDVLIGSLKTLISSATSDIMSMSDVILSNDWDLMSLLSDWKEDADINTVVDYLSNALNGGEQRLEPTFQDVGFYLSAGIALGVSSGTYLIENACRAAVAAARAAAMAEADAHSPSLVFAQIGGFLSSGMAIGITEGQGEVVNSMTNLTDEVINGATTAMATMSSLMSQEIDANPTITPVLDLSNVKSGANYINGVLGGDRDYNLSTGSGGDYASNAVPRSGRTSGEYQGTDLTGITARLNDLGNRITAMGNQMSNLQIVMDSGELVGSISGGVSSKIGRKSTYNRRRNA